MNTYAGWSEEIFIVGNGFLTTPVPQQKCSPSLDKIGMVSRRTAFVIDSLISPG